MNRSFTKRGIVFALLLFISVPAICFDRFNLKLFDDVPSSISEESVKYLKELNTLYPSLGAQIKNCIDSELSICKEMDFNNAIKNLYSYVKNTTNLEIGKGLKIILYEEYYNKLKNTLSSSIKIDGNDDDWINIITKSTDVKGDGFNDSGMDLIESGAIVDENLTLNVFFKVNGKPEKEQCFDIFIDVPGTDGYDFEVWALHWTDGKIYYQYNDFINKKSGLSFNGTSARGDVYELSVPLKDIGITTREGLKVIARTMDVNFKKVDDSGVLPLMSSIENYPLILLLYMMDKKYFSDNDPITMALVMANNYLYTNADNETKIQIETDLYEHYMFYTKLVKWQKDSDLLYAIKDAPMIAKIFWADRNSRYNGILKEMMSKNTTGKLTLEVYLEVVDKISIYNELREMLIKENLISQSLYQTCSNIENFIHLHQKYRSSMENMNNFNDNSMISDENLLLAKEEYDNGEYLVNYMGRERRWDEFYWLNYQMKLFNNENVCKGDCATATTMHMSSYKVFGIAPASFQYAHPQNEAKYSHNFPSFYNKQINKWNCVQNLNYSSQFHNSDGNIKDMEMFFYFNKPIYHSWKSNNELVTLTENGKIKYYYEYYQGEQTNTKKLVNFLKIGMDHDLMESLFYSDITQNPGTIFNEVSAPEELLDSDYDNLNDVLEKQLGLNIYAVDTDKDFITDEYEIENGLDALVKNKNINHELFIDGLIDLNEVDEYRYVIERKNKNQNGRIYNIQKLYIDYSLKDLYVAVDYANDIKKNLPALHTFNFTGIDKSKNIKYNYWIQVTGKYFAHLTITDEKGVKIKDEDIIRVCKWFSMEDFEFLLPIEYFENIDLIYGQYSILVDKGNGEWRVSDSLSSIRMNMNSGNLDQAFISEPISQSDLMEDAKNQSIFLFDCKSISLIEDDSSYYFCIDYFNDINNNPYGIHSFHFRNPDNQNNWWIQWYNYFDLVFGTWVDGKEFSNVAVDYSKFDSEIIKGKYYFKVPKELFSNCLKLELTYQVGGTNKESKYIVDDDVCPILTIKK